MTTARLHYPISTMTLAPDAGWRTARPARTTIDPEVDAMNPFARRPRGAMLSLRERAGLLAVYAAIAAVAGVALFR